MHKYVYNEIEQTKKTKIRCILVWCVLSQERASLTQRTVYS